MRDTGYREALVSYIDILGFGKLIETSAIDPSAIPTILNTLRHLKKQTSEGGRVIRELENQRPTSIFRAFSFSDLTVRTTFTDTPSNYIDILRWEFLYLSSIQVNLICDLDILLRGGISIGQISIEPNAAINDDVLFGPALVRSYELECKTAVSPRLVIDPPVIQRAKENPGKLWPEYYRKDEDGEFFLDYLFGAVTDSLLSFGGKPLGHVETLQKHKNRIERKINDLADKNTRIREKLRWLVDYHNGVVRRLQELHSKGPDPFDVFDYQPPAIPDSVLIADESVNQVS
jgi:hypothetical protein